MPVYKISCEFYVKADSENDAFMELAGDPDFAENHLIAEEVKEESIDKSQIYADCSTH